MNDMNKFYYVYVLLSKKDWKTYTGSTSNLKERIKKHENGLVLAKCARTKSTKIN